MVGSKTFISGAANVNIDLFFSGLPRLPEEGQELYSKGFSLQMGGGLPATLINLGRLGIPVRIQTGLGKDMFSRFARDAFESAGVTPFNLCPQTDAIPLNISVAMLTPGDRTFCSYSDGFPVTDTVLEQVYADSKGASICAMDLRFPEVYRQLHQEGTLLTLDTGWDDEMSIEKYRPMLELADFYTPNQKEALKITGTNTPEEAARVLSEFFQKVVVKLDASGCLIQENGVQQVIPVIPEYVHQDSTGAGDAFWGGFLYRLLHQGYPMEAQTAGMLADCLTFGNRVGAYCVGHLGAISGMPTMAQLETMQ